MKRRSFSRSVLLKTIISGFFLPVILFAQGLETPLGQEILNILTNEISGQLIFNNEVILAGAPWIREQREFTDTFYESGKIYEIARRYGIETIQIERHPREGNFDYPLEGEFWILKPKLRQMARLGADAALVTRGSQSVDVTGELIYIPPLNREEIDSIINTKRYSAGSPVLSRMKKGWFSVPTYSKVIPNGEPMTI